MTTTSVRQVHYHATTPYMPRSKSYYLDPEDALDAIAEGLVEWANETVLGGGEYYEDQITSAAATAELYRRESRSAEHGDLVYRLTERGQVHELYGGLTFLARRCEDHCRTS